MITSIPIHISVSKRIILVQNAIEEFIHVEILKNHFKHSYYSITDNTFTVEINENETPTNIVDMMLKISLISSSNSKVTVVKTEWIYKLKKDTILRRLWHICISKQFIKNNATCLLRDFKKKSEKWL